MQILRNKKCTLAAAVLKQHHKKNARTIADLSQYSDFCLQYSVFYNCFVDYSCVVNYSE